MAYTTIKIKRRKFIASYTYDYRHMIIEGTDKNLSYLIKCFKDKNLVHYIDIFSDYIRIENITILKML